MGIDNALLIRLMADFIKNNSIEDLMKLVMRAIENTRE